MSKFLFVLSFLTLAIYVPGLRAGCDEECGGAENVCICAVEPGAEAVHIVRLGSLDREPVEVGTMVELGDELTGPAGAAVELRCPGGSSITLSNAFRAVLMPIGDGADCAVTHLSGSVDVQANQETAVVSGETLMASKRTQYRLTAYRRRGELLREAVVYDGLVELKASMTGRTVDMKPGSKGLIRGKTWRRARISNRDFASTASVYARMDVSKVRRGNLTRDEREKYLEAYQASYNQVLRKPNDPQSRLNLAVLQVNTNLSSEALYNLNKVERQASADPTQKAVAAAAKGVAYGNLGQRQAAADQFQKVKKLDPKVDTKVLQNYKLSPKAIEQVIRVAPQMRSNQLQPQVRPVER